MKDTLGIVLMIMSPFIVGALILAGIKFQEMYQQWKYENAVAERNQKLQRYGVTPFRGTKLRTDINIDYSSGREAYRFKKGVHR